MQESTWHRFVKEEWLLVVSILGLLATSLYLRRIPTYDFSDFTTLYTLFVLFAIVNGLQKHRVLSKVALRMEDGRFLPVRLLLITFFFSMIVTNDVAVLSIVPVTLALNISGEEWVVILEALAANAGSTLSPFGNPQNLFVYWHYGIPFWQFVKAILPFSLSFLALLLLMGIAVSYRIRGRRTLPQTETIRLDKLAYIYLVALVIFILCIVQVLPLWLGIVVLLGIFIVERGKIHADYPLLATFAVFFGFTDNLKVLLAPRLAHSHHVFLLSSLLSQAISNVPAALLVADFTDRWRALLWGVSVGGYGSLIGSMASLIAYRLHQKDIGSVDGNFLIKFHAVSYGAFFIGWLMYLIFYQVAG